MFVLGHVLIDVFWGCVHMRAVGGKGFYLCLGWDCSSPRLYVFFSDCILEMVTCLLPL